MYAAADDPAMARQLSEAMAITSSGANVVTNSLFGVRAADQHAMGNPILSGLYPNEQGEKLTGMYADQEWATGLKHRAFGDALARGGGFESEYTPERPVNDIWQGEAWGYMQPDGKPLRRGFSDAEHAWMDRMSDKALAIVRRDPLLSKVIPSDKGQWTLSRLQAAAWAGAKRLAVKNAREAAVRQGKTAKVGGMGQVGEFGPGIERLYRQDVTEQTPGASTQHMQELRDQTPQGEDDRQLLHDLMRLPQAGLYDKKGRSRIGSQILRVPVGHTSEAIGYYKGEKSPAVIVNTPVAHHELDTPAGATRLDASGLEAMRAGGAIHALHNAQELSAGGAVVAAGRGVTKDGGDIRLKRGNPDAPTFSNIWKIIHANGGTADTIAAAPRDWGVTLINLKDWKTGDYVVPEAQFVKMVHAVNKAHGQVGGVNIGKWDGYADFNDWSQPRQQFGQTFYKPIEPVKEAYRSLVGPDMALERIPGRRRDEQNDRGPLDREQHALPARDDRGGGLAGAEEDLAAVRGAGGAAGGVGEDGGHPRDGDARRGRDYGGPRCWRSVARVVTSCRRTVARLRATRAWFHRSVWLSPALMRGRGSGGGSGRPCATRQARRRRAARVWLMGWPPFLRRPGGPAARSRAPSSDTRCRP